jgi:hypothetical protein
MKRLLLVVALCVALAPAVSASASTHLSSQLLTGKNLSKQWSRYYIQNQDTATCPESNFARPTSKSSTRAIFANNNSGTLILEKLTATKNPAALYNTLVSQTLRCPKSGKAVSENVTYQRVRSVQISGIAKPHRAFSLAAQADGSSVTGCVVYAVKGDEVVAFAELSILPFSARQFKTTLEKALAKVAA